MNQIKVMLVFYRKKMKKQKLKNNYNKIPNKYKNEKKKQTIYDHIYYYIVCNVKLQEIY